MREIVKIELPINIIDQLAEALPPHCRFANFEKNIELIFWTPGCEIHIEPKEIINALAKEEI